MKTNNKLREALETLVDLVDTWKDHLPPAIRDGEVSSALNKANVVLDEPTKNCEVGTAKEQGERFTELCNQRRLHSKCPPGSCACCAIAWAQTPYDGCEMNCKDIDLSSIGAVCSSCAHALGFKPKNKTVGVWIGECEVCHKRKACTDLHHDWNPRKQSLAGKG